MKVKAGPLSKNFSFNVKIDDLTKMKISLLLYGTKNVRKKAFEVCTVVL